MFYLQLRVVLKRAMTPLLKSRSPNKGSHAASPIKGKDGLLESLCSPFSLALDVSNLAQNRMSGGVRMSKTAETLLRRLSYENRTCLTNAGVVCHSGVRG